MDIWYRVSMERQGYFMDTMKIFEEQGDPEWRKAADLERPLSYKERISKGIGRWAPNPAMYNDPKNRYQGGSDSDYRNRGKGNKKGKDKAKTRTEERHQYWSDARWEPGDYGDYASRPPTHSSSSSSSRYESYGRW